MNHQDLKEWISPGCTVETGKFKHTFTQALTHTPGAYPESFKTEYL